MQRELEGAEAEEAHARPRRAQEGGRRLLFSSKWPWVQIPPFCSHGCVSQASHMESLSPASSIFDVGEMKAPACGTEVSHRDTGQYSLRDEMHVFK